METALPRKPTAFSWRDAIGLPTIWLVFWSIKHPHQWPSVETWGVTILGWFAFYSVLGGYKRIVWEMECHNALLRQILTRMEENQGSVPTARNW